MAGAVCATLLIVSPVKAASDKPNIVIILADDLGNADLGYRGSDIKTPNIDKLAEDGVRLEDFYGMPVCTPARAELMTGRYAMRYGLETLVIFPSHTYGLPTDERTLAQALKDVGYETEMVGKWHLGHADTNYWPQNRGFDHFYGNLVGEVDYFTKERGGNTMAAPPALCSPPARGRRKSARKVAAWGLKRRRQRRTASFAAAKARCTKVACACRPSSIGPPS